MNNGELNLPAGKIAMRGQGRGQGEGRLAAAVKDILPYTLEFNFGQLPQLDLHFLADTHLLKYIL